LQKMTTPEEFRQYRAESIQKIVEAKDKFAFMLPKIARQAAGGQILSIQDNPMMPGYGQPIAGANIAMTMTPGEVASNKIAQGNLSLAQQRLAFERANPTLSIQEDPSGLVAVNTRTGIAIPVVYGPNGIQAAPAAAPGTSVMRQPTAATPSQRTPAIPGMTSVLDQTAPAAVNPASATGATTPGTRVAGKFRDAPENFVKTDNQLANLTGSLKSFKDEVKNNQVTGAKGLFRGSDTARMTAKYQSLLMGVKDLYTLGALTGPDLGIIESQLTNPASWSGKMTSQKGFEEQIQVLEDMLKRNVTNLENSYGRQPKASKKALESLGGGGGEWSVVK
jgi:hypothetical protein